MDKNFSIDDIDWKEMILRLTAFAVAFAKERSWFRGKETDTFLAGKKAEDYAMEAIARFIEAPEKYNPDERSLFSYLTMHLVRGLISNDVTKAENKDCFPLSSGGNSNGDKEDEITHVEKLMPYVEPLFADNIDYEAVKAYIESKIQGDKDVEYVFMGIYSFYLKRNDILKEFNLTAGAYNNAMRRLDTVLRQTAVHFTEKRTVV